MDKSILNEQDYYRKVFGGWLGKNIGGTLGGFVEGRTELMDMTFYPEVPDKPLANDDLDLQLVWLHALEQYGARITSKELGQEWVEHIFFPFDEYGYTLTNLRCGLQAPVSGSFNNPFKDCMGSPIRSEIWAMVAPGAPGVAAYYAYQDAIVDHAGGEGVYGEMFFAAIESAAFLESDRDRLIEIGLAFIPEQCRTARAVKDVIQWFQSGKTWIEARELIVGEYGRYNFTDAPQNIAFTILGWLYGTDFEDSLLKAVNCGYDTDCTGATLGAILGIIGGADCIPERWVQPIGHSVVVSPQIKGFQPPSDLEDLTRRTLAVSKEVMAIWNIPVVIDPVAPTQVVEDNIRIPGNWNGDYDPRWLVGQSALTNRYLLPGGAALNRGLEVTIDYGQGGPTIGVAERKTLTITLLNQTEELWEGKFGLEVPSLWNKEEGRYYQLQPEEKLVWETFVESGSEQLPFYELSFQIDRWHDDSLWNSHNVRFTLLPTNYWKLWGPDSTESVEMMIPGNRISFPELLGTEASGTYAAQTTLINPRKRNVRLIVGTRSPVKACLNDEVLLEDREMSEFVPGYHRSYIKRLFEVELDKGSHVLDIQVEKGDELLELYVLPVAFTQTKTPGGNFYFTDILFGPANKDVNKDANKDASKE
ncbi:ADP-ribosylglycohydrolase family protein [Paenibacillus eucommiae]|uniref:ADP-ribosylglycohydrolase n=1 Tax=Paenibacillus eucommiae TaxID=1355755 RepID=A0ABS4ISZ9_9BACL|nr:ADP-ribosylglycohydrolase family protein [Paenibacillus eucommiae]MBP1990692.1 ADP-ribosylglycohydrolase [Paenibacillus eucommiae]